MVWGATVGKAVCVSAVLCGTNEQGAEARCSIRVEMIPFCSKSCRRGTSQTLAGVLMDLLPVDPWLCIVAVMLKSVWAQSPGPYCWTLTEALHCC